MNCPNCDPPVEMHIYNAGSNLLKCPKCNLITWANPPLLESIILERINRAAQVVPTQIEDLLMAAELMAACANVGMKPQHLLLAVIDKYPHHVESIIDTLALFYQWANTPRIEDQIPATGRQGIWEWHPERKAIP